MTDSLLSPEEIQDRLEAVRSDGYPPAEVGSLLGDLLQFCTGADAEEAVVDLIANVDDDERMSALVRSYVMREGRLFATYSDYSRTHAPFVLTELAEQGFSPIEDNTGIHVGMPDGQVIDEPWKVTNGLKRKGQTICSAALKAAAVMTIRNRAQEG